VSILASPLIVQLPFSVGYCRCPTEEPRERDSDFRGHAKPRGAFLAIPVSWRIESATPLARRTGGHR
jgi:hypothetical protein